MVSKPQSEPSSKAGKFILQFGLILLVFVLGLYHLKSAIVAQVAVTRGAYLEVLLQFQTDPDVLSDLARHEHNLNRNNDKALLFYKRAINSFVLHAPSWLGLTELLYDLDRKKQAAATLKVAHTIPVNTIEHVWSKAELAHELNEGQILLSSLSWLADNDEFQRTRIFNLVNKTWDDPFFLMKNFNITHYPNLLQMYIRSNQLLKAQAVWRNIEENDINYPKVTTNYVNYLLSQNEFDLAVDVWAYTFRRDGSLLYNGNFDGPILNAGFGWRMSESDSTTLEQADLDKGLTVVFDGTENVALRLAQTIPIYPGEHVFKGTFETDSLTSEQLPFWKITGYNCAGLYIEDLMVPPSEHTTEFEIPFNVPQGCKAIQIALVRNRASDYDSIISGSITVDNLDIIRISPPPVFPSKLEETERVQQNIPVHEPEPELSLDHVEKPAARLTMESIPEPVVELVEQEIDIPGIEEVGQPVAEMSSENATEADAETEDMPPEEAQKTNITINRIEIRP